MVDSTTDVRKAAGLLGVAVRHVNSPIGGFVVFGVLFVVFASIIRSTEITGDQLYCLFLGTLAILSIDLAVFSIMAIFFPRNLTFPAEVYLELEKQERVPLQLSRKEYEQLIRILPQLAADLTEANLDESELQNLANAISAVDPPTDKKSGNEDNAGANILHPSYTDDELLREARRRGLIK